MTLQHIQPIAENLWWVLPGKLAGVRKPTRDELPQLQAKGIGAIISVLDDPSNLDLYQKAGIPHLWLPIQGGTSPSYKQLIELNHFIDAQTKQGQAVALHCTNGKRRTGTALAAHLISNRASFETALQAILTANPKVELREAQVTFLRELAKTNLSIKC